MSNRRPPAGIPGYRRRSGYNQAIVTLTDSLSKKRRDFWLGEFGSPESRERYHRVVAAWEANGRRFPRIEADPPLDAVHQITVVEIILEYWHWGEPARKLCTEESETQKGY